MEQAAFEIRPQPGPQEAFLATSADVAIYGGMAFGGKSFALLMEPLRHIRVPGFSAVIFRRQYTQITNPGGLWDESAKLYKPFGGIPREMTLEWNFPPNDTVVKFAHMQLERDKYSWDGAQVTLVEFDQLETFTWTQFAYLFKATRTGCNVLPYTRASCNPDSTSFLRKFLGWWIDDDTGLAIKERAGKLKYFKVENDEVIWSDRPQKDFQSLTFFPASRYDNVIGMKLNPGYDAKLASLPLVDRMRQAEGNWNEPPSVGGFFKKEWFKIIPAAPADVVVWVRYWDRAATEPNPQNQDPDWTVGALVGKTIQGYTIIADVVRVRLSPGGVERTILNTASQDGTGVIIGLEQDPGSAGKSEVQSLIRVLNGYNVQAVPKRQNKEVAAKPLSAQAEAGNVQLVRGAWNDVFMTVLEHFPSGNHDDDVDSASGGYNMLYNTKIRWLPPSQKPKEQPPDEEQSKNKVLPFYPIRRRII